VSQRSSHPSYHSTSQAPSYLYLPYLPPSKASSPGLKREVIGADAQARNTTLSASYNPSSLSRRTTPSTASPRFGSQATTPPCSSIRTRVFLAPRARPVVTLAATIRPLRPTTWIGWPSIGLDRTSMPGWGKSG
jgi:hypothetical protein